MSTEESAMITSEIKIENDVVVEPITPATVEDTNTRPKPKIMFRWKGKIVKESIYRQRMAVSESSKKRRKAADEEPKIPVEGRRVVDLQLLAKHMQCTSCKEILSLRNIKSETRRGLASIFHVRCHGCSLINIVPTSSKTVCNDSTKGKMYDVNTEFVNGSAQSGITRNRLNKLLSCLNIPPVQWKLFQRYRQESQEKARVSATENLTKDNLPTAENLTNDNLSAIANLTKDNLPADTSVRMEVVLKSEANPQTAMRIS